MENQPLVQEQNAIPETNDTARIKLSIQLMFQRMHDAIRIPLLSTELKNPLTDAERLLLVTAAANDIRNIGSRPLAYVIINLIENLMYTHVIRKLERALSYRPFFQYCVSFDNYIDHFAKWIDEMLAPVEREEGSPLTGKFMVDVAFEQIIKLCHTRLKMFFVDTTFYFRSWHSYMADWAFDAVYNDRFVKVVKRLIFYGQRRSGNNEFETTHVNVVKNEVKRNLDKLPDHMNLREFLANVTAAWNQEWKLYNKLFDAPAYTKEEFKERILASAFESYVQRTSISDHSYFSVVDVMTAEDSDFDPRLLRDLFFIFTHTDECFTTVVDNLKDSLGVHAKKHFFPKVENVFCKDIHLPEWNFDLAMRDFGRAVISYTRRWRRALRESLRIDQLEYMNNTLSEGIFHLIVNPRAIENIEKIGEWCSEYLCGIKGQKQRDMKPETVVDFYRTVANQKSLARHAANGFLRSIDEKTVHSSLPLYHFCDQLSISEIPNEVQVILRWIKEGERVSVRMNNNENVMKIILKSDRTMKVSGTVFPEKYRPTYEPNLLRKSEEFVDIDRRFASITRQQCQLKIEERLCVQNAKSTVRIRTKLFGNKTHPITLILTVYQHSVVFYLGRKRRTTVKNLCTDLIRGDVKEDREKKLAAKVTKLVLMSLLQPFQLVKILSSQTNQEIHPSRPEDISFSHHITLNQELQIEEESLQLPTPDLRMSEVEKVKDEEEEAGQGAARVNPFKLKTAKLALIVRCRSKCATSPNNLVDEEETISEVHDKVRGFSVDMQTVRFAAECLIQEGNLERHQVGGFSMLKFIRGGAED